MTNSVSPRVTFRRISISLGMTRPVDLPTAVSLRVVIVSFYLHTYIYKYGHNHLLSQWDRGIELAAELVEAFRLNSDALLASRFLFPVFAHPGLPALPRRGIAAA